MGESYRLEPQKGWWMLQAGAMEHEWVNGLVVVPGKQLLQAANYRAWADAMARH